MVITPMLRAVLAGSVLGLGGCVAAPAQVASAPPPNCRQYTTTLSVGGTTQPGFGVECMQADGTWRWMTPPVSSPDAVPPPGAVAAYPGYPAYPTSPYYNEDVWGDPWYFGPGDVGLGVGLGRGGWHGGGGRWHGGRGWSGGGGERR